MLGAKPSRQRDLVLAMLVQRILFLCSKLATTRDWHNTTLAAELNVAEAKEEDLYAARTGCFHGSGRSKASWSRGTSAKAAWCSTTSAVATTRA